jgi:hypothetical protein
MATIPFRIALEARWSVIRGESSPERVLFSSLSSLSASVNDRPSLSLVGFRMARNQLADSVAADCGCAGRLTLSRLRLTRA